MLEAGKNVERDGVPTFRLFREIAVARDAREKFLNFSVVFAAGYAFESCTRSTFAPAVS